MEAGRSSTLNWDGSICASSHVSVDFFLRDASVYLLSHAHVDHMKGLDERFCGEIWSTEITKQLLLLRFPKIDSSRVHTLDFFEPTFLDRAGVNVTCIPANHCPGSCMFIVESDKFKTLFTGDFRFDPAMLEEPMLKGPFDEVILDTTFAEPIFERLPSKEEAVRQVLSLIQSSSPSRQVFLECDMLGTEPVLEAIVERFGCKVHIQNADRYAQLLMLGMEGKVTLDEAQSRFHCVPFTTLTAVANGDSKLLSKRSFSQGSNVSIPKRDEGGLFIKPSVQFFKHKSLTLPEAFLSKPTCMDGVYHVLYSGHSSFSELKQFSKHVAAPRLRALASCPSRCLSDLLLLSRQSSDPKTLLKVDKMTTSLRQQEQQQQLEQRASAKNKRDEEQEQLFDEIMSMLKKSKEMKTNKG